MWVKGQESSLAHLVFDCMCLGLFLKATHDERGDCFRNKKGVVCPSNMIIPCRGEQKVGMLTAAHLHMVGARATTGTAHGSGFAAPRTPAFDMPLIVCWCRSRCVFSQWALVAAGIMCLASMAAASQAGAAGVQASRRAQMAASKVSVRSGLDEMLTKLAEKHVGEKNGLVSSISEGAYGDFAQAAEDKLSSDNEVNVMVTKYTEEAKESQNSSAFHNQKEKCNASTWRALFWLHAAPQPPQPCI